jgi:hypothetical protein
MELIKQFFAKIVSGFLLGVGFVVAFGLLGGYAISHMTTSRIESSPESIVMTRTYKSKYKEYDETAKLSVKVNTEKIGDGSFVLLGEIINNGEDSWQMVNLQADLFDAKGKFIEQCSEYVSQTVRPGDIVNFKLACRSQSCNTVDVNGFESYKLNIASAHFVQDRSAE